MLLSGKQGERGGGVNYRAALLAAQIASHLPDVCCILPNYLPVKQLQNLLLHKLRKLAALLGRHLLLQIRKVLQPSQLQGACRISQKEQRVGAERAFSERVVSLEDKATRETL